MIILQHLNLSILFAILALLALIFAMYIDYNQSKVCTSQKKVILFLRVCKVIVSLVAFTCIWLSMFLISH